ncbi:MAG: hypothetical protein ABJC62_00595 [Frankiaceae bacterium]
MAAFEDLVQALDRPPAASTVTSVRQPEALRQAMRAAVELGWAASSNDGLNQAVRVQLEAFAQRLALDAHYAAYPDSRPGLAEVAQALAELDHSPLAEHPELLRAAASEVLAVRPDADADDVVLWAASLHRHGFSSSSDVTPPHAAAGAGRESRRT